MNLKSYFYRVANKKRQSTKGDVIEEDEEYIINHDTNKIYSLKEFKSFLYKKFKNGSL